MQAYMLRPIVRRPRLAETIILLTGVFAMAAGPAVADQHRLSDRHTMMIDRSARQQLGEELFKEIESFFHRAEMAIQSRNLKSLMVLYSDNYRDGQHDKESANQIWQRIFKRFQELATRHNMRLVTVSSDNRLVVMRCSGLLIGIPSEQAGPITIDNWTNQDHVLTKEGGQWKLIGSFGKERKRLWFDKPMHPLF